ncbi:uncharacterized protein LOC105274584 isoform X2 [Ooceraea biroi]|uniref:uncharacterized protein LOC105274584 isoform X2 n=1 Tax=Ooceraea biroi TaxID=2015173 RepID=UPI0005B93BF1|nr:uncharacterized protein LOC105274584 isoform X2 [Ooceraea biroi]
MKPFVEADYCFCRLKETARCVTGKECSYTPRLKNFNLEKLRLDLWKYFEIPKDRHIFYVDEDTDVIPIESEGEFHEMFKLAKDSTIEKPIHLIVGPYNGRVSKLREVDDSSDDQKRDIDSSSSCLESTSKLGQRRWKPLNLMKKWDRKRHKSNEEQKELKDMEAPKMDASLCGIHSDMPPPWFTKYMDSMKEEMISTISQRVINCVMEALNDDFSPPLPPKKLEETLNDDFPPPLPPRKLPAHLYQSKPRSIVSPRRYSDYCNLSDMKRERKVMHQDEEQSSDESDDSIECVDEPQDAPEDLRVKKDVRSIVRHETVKEMTEVPNKTSRDRPVHAPFKRFIYYEDRSHLPFPKRFSRYSFESRDLNEKSQEKMRCRDAEQLSDDARTKRMDESQNVNSARSSRSLQERIDLLQDAICDFANANVKEKKKKKRNFHQLTTKNMDTDTCKGQQLCSRKTEFASPPLQANQAPYDERLHLEALKLLENELRMSCSVTGHQMLDEDRRNKNIWSYNDLHIDSSVYDSSEVDDDAFEIIQVSTSKDMNETHPEESLTEQQQHQQQHDSSRDSPSFELLSELPSPTSTCMNEDLLLNKETEERPEPEEKPESMEKLESKEKIEQQFENPDPRLVYMLNTKGKIRQYYCKKDISHRATKAAPVVDAQCSELLHDGTTSSSYGDVKNSHPSYMPVSQCRMPQSQRSCQSQIDLIDFTQSFHSHTTSVTTDITDAIDMAEVYVDACDNGRCGEQQVPTVSKNVQEMTETATARIETDPTVASSRNELEDEWMKKLKEKYYCDVNGDSSPTPDASAAASQQFCRANGFSDKPMFNGRLQGRCIVEPDALDAEGEC